MSPPVVMLRVRACVRMATCGLKRRVRKTKDLGFRSDFVLAVCIVCIVCHDFGSNTSVRLLLSDFISNPHPPWDVCSYTSREAPLHLHPSTTRVELGRSWDPISLRGAWD